MKSKLIHNMILQQPKATDSLETWLSYLEKSHFKPIDMGLERVQAVAQALNLTKPAPYVITVGGTNGKGSTCKLIETVLLLSGLRVGVYSSPHLIHYNERIRIQGNNVTDEALIASFDYIEKQRTHSLTYFEFGTLSALDLFRRAKLDVVILEVGLGGRLDATNIIDPNIAVITAIDIDHVEFLGNDREMIGREKAGIFRANIPVIIGEPGCPQTILEHAKSLKCNVFQRNRDWQFNVKSDYIQWQSNQQTTPQYIDFPLPKIPIPNVATAIATLTQLPFHIEQAVIKEAISTTRMVGRFQQLTIADFTKSSQTKPLANVIVDVGHNPHAARYLATQLQALKLPESRIYTVFSALVDKDLSNIVHPLADIIDEWHCAGLTGYRGQSGADVQEKLTAQLPNAKTMHYPNVASASKQVFELARAQDTILIFGSFHTVADFMLWLGLN